MAIARTKENQKEWKVSSPAFAPLAGGGGTPGLRGGECPYKISATDACEARRAHGQNLS